MQATSAMITGGGTTYEGLVSRVRARLPSLMQGGLILIGLSHIGAECIDLSKSQIPDPDLLSGNSGPDVSAFVVKALREGIPPAEITLPDRLKAAHENRPALIRTAEAQLSLL